MFKPAIHDLHFTLCCYKRSQHTVDHKYSQQQSPYVSNVSQSPSGYRLIFSSLNANDITSLLSSCFGFFSFRTDVRITEQQAACLMGCPAICRCLFAHRYRLLHKLCFSVVGHDQSCSQRRNKDKRSRILPDAIAAEGGGPASPPLF